MKRSGKLPRFERETVCGVVASPTTLLKPNEVELTSPIPPFPVPLRTTLCGEPATKSLKSNVALLFPFTVGVNVMDTLQLAAVPKDGPHVLVRLKSLAPEPVNQMFEIENGLPPILVTVRICAALVTPTGSAVKLIAEALSDAMGPAPVAPVPDKLKDATAEGACSELVVS
jgi:hypothetical protein